MKHARIACIFAIAALVAACGEPPAAEQNNIASADIDVLPPDDSVATPSDDLANGAVDAPPGDNSTDSGSSTAMPAALRGRWGLTANDCQPGRSDAKGLVTITADRIEFYESVARPQTIRTISDSSVRGTFAFIGEGQNWTRDISWSVEDGKLVRADSEPAARLVYTRC